MKTIFKTFFLALLFLNTACNKTVINQDENETTVKEIDSLVSEWHQNNLFNGNVLISKNNTIIYQKSFGYADASRQTKLNPTSIFNIGSVAKQFNAVSIMMLQEKGMLDLNDPISKFGLGLPAWSEKVTIKHLLNYAGGIAKIDKMTTTSDAEAWKILHAADSLLFEPGSNFNYDNNVVFLQRRIIEKVSGLSFEEFVLKNIVQPLDMKTAVVDPHKEYSNRTSGFRKDGTAYDELQFISGWLWLDTNDLLKWFEALHNNTLISKASFDYLLRNPYAKYQTSSLGEYFEDQKLQRHNGTAPGFRSMTLNDFDKDITIIVLANTSSNVVKLGHDLHTLFYTSIAQAIREDVFKDAATGIAKYQQLKTEFPDVYNFNNPRELNTLGYELLRSGNTEASIQVFTLATQEFPNNPNAYDSLGESYFENQQYDLALKNYQKVLSLDHASWNAPRMIQKIQSVTE